MNDNTIIQFREGSMALALEGGYPVVTPENRFVHDARCAWLLDALEQHITSTHEPRSRPGWFSASALGDTDEELIAAYRGEEKPAPDAKLARVFSVGHDRDLTYKKWLHDAGLSAVGSDDDRKIRIPHLRLQGEADDILRSPTGFTVYEGKTINPYSFRKLEEPLPAHKLQVTAYMAGLALQDAIVLYECKGSQDWRAFYVPFDATLWSDTVTRLLRLRALAEGEPIESK